MKEELERTDGGIPAIYSGALIDIAEQAEKRVDAILKIKKVALKVTNKFDWTNQQDRPYLQVSGSEKIANLFNISWRIDEPRLEFEDDGHFTYTYKGEFSLAGRTIEIEGSRSSKDPFFKKYDYFKSEDGKSIKTEKPISAIDKRDVKMAALTNLLGNGISRILGIRNLQWSDLEEFAGIKKAEVNEIQYSKGGDKPSLKEPQKKATGEAKPSPEEPTEVQVLVKDVTLKTGKGDKGEWTLYKITTVDDLTYQTFNKDFGEIAVKEKSTGMPIIIEFKPVEFKGKDGQTIQGKEIVSLKRAEREPGSEG